MVDKVKYFVGFVTGILAVFALAFLLPDTETTRVYDCGMAEWHPDIPREVKEECRKRRYENLQKQITSV